jgi:hypothetical protein
MKACAAAERSAAPPEGLLSGRATLRAKASMACAVGSWGGQRPGLGGYVTGTGVTSGVLAAGGR